jgi:hypothetical protein
LHTVKRPPTKNTEVNMKTYPKWAILFTILFLFNCATQRLVHVPERLTTLILDLSRYSAEGFFITPYEYQADYESIGLINTIIMPEATREKIDTGRKDEEGNTVYKKVWVLGNVSAQEAIADMVEGAKTLGADAIMEFSIKEKAEQYFDPVSPLTVQGFELSGFAIKRKGAFE